MAINFDAEAFAAANPVIEEDKFDAEAFVAANPLEGPPDPLIPVKPVDPDLGGTSPPFSDMSNTGLVDDPAFDISQEQSEEDVFSNLIQGTASEPEDPIERKRGPSIKSTGPITARERKDGDEARSSYLLEDLLKAGYKETIARNKVVEAVERLEASEDFMSKTPSQFNVPGMPPELQSDLLFDEVYSRPEEFKQEQQVAAMKLLGEADNLLAESAPVKHTPSVEKALRADSFTGAWSYFTENPIDFILEVSAKSGAGMAQSIGTGIAGAAATGSPLGFAAGLGIGSGKVEFAASVLEGLEASGVDINDRTSILEFVSDEESMEALYDHAYMRAGIIGTVDAVTGGIASKTLTPVTSLLSKVGVQSPKAAKIADNLVAQAGVQILGGSGGEAAAQLATTGELKEGEVFAEGVAGLVTAPIDVTVATIAAGNSPTNQEMKVDLSVFDDPEGLLNVGATPEEGLIDTGIILLDGNTVIDVIPDEDVTVLATVEDRPADKKVPMFDEDGTFIDYGKEDYLSTRFDTETTVAETPVTDQPTQSPEENLVDWLDDAEVKIKTIIKGLKQDKLTASGAPRKGSFGDVSDPSFYVEYYEGMLSEIYESYNLLADGKKVGELTTRINGDIGGYLRPDDLDTNVPFIPLDIRTRSLRDRKGQKSDYDDRYGEFPFDQTREVGLADNGIDQTVAEVPTTPKFETEPSEGQIKYKDKVYEDTRGKGVQYHGARNEIKTLDEAGYASLNIYGQGFYTTDARADVAKGYQRKSDTGVTYQVEEIKDVNLFDADQQITTESAEEVLGSLEDRAVDMGLDMPFIHEGTEMLYESLDEVISSGGTWLDLFDDIRQTVDESADFIQEMFDDINESIEQAGFDGLSYVGGSKTGTKAHNVKQYFNPQESIKITKVDEAKPVVISEMKSRTEEAIKKNPLYNKVKDAGIDPTPEVIAKATTVEQKVNESNKGQGIEDWNPGWNYVPMWDDNPKNKDQIEYDLRPTSEFRGKDPIRREKILRPLLKQLDIPLFQGNIAGTRGPGKGNVLGYYRTGKNLIRIKNNSDLEVTAHEIAHLIDYKFPEIKKFYTANRFPEEMKNLQYGRTERALADKDPFFVGPQPLVGPALESISVSYEKSIPEEGFAEFHRLYMTQPEEAKRRTPNIYNWYDNWLDTQEIGPAIKKAGLEMQAWYKQDPRLRMMSKVGTVKSINDSMNLRDWGQSVRMGMVDDLQGIKRTEVNADGSISYTGPYATGRLTKGTDSVVLAAIRFGVPVWDNTEGVAKISKGSEGLQNIFDFASVSPKLKGSQLKAFMDYMYAVSSRELHQQGRQFRFTDSEMDSVIKDAEKNNPQFEEAFRRYLKWNQGIVNFAVDGGLLSQKEVDGWQRMMYVPMFNVETSGRKTPGRKRLDDAGAGISRLFGSTANLNPTSENILKNARMLISATLVNAAKRDFVDFALESDRMGNTLEKLLKKPKTVSVTKEQVSKVIDDIIEEAGIVEEEQVDAMKDVLEDYPDFMNFLAFGNQQRGPNVLQIMRNGKPVEYEVIDPMAYRSLQLYNKPQQNVLINMLAQPSNVLKRIVVTGGDFLATSVWRDAIGRFFFTESGQSFVEQARGTFSALMKDEKYQEFLLNGGGYSGYINSEPQLRKMMRKLNPATTPMGKIARVILSPYDVFLAVEELSNAMEQGQKVAEFKKLQEQGMPTRAATLRGREMGGDFAMAGSNEIFRAYATTIPFLQPALTGMDRARAGVTEQGNKGTVMAKMAAAGGVVAGLVAMQLIHFPDEYEQLEEWEKRAFVNLFYRDLNGELKLFRLPKPFDVGVIMSTAEEAAEFSYKMATKEMDVTEAGKEFGVGVLNSMLSVVTSIPGAPVKSENDDWYEPFLKPLTSMQAVKPFYEIATNKDQFTGAPIETFGEQRLTPALRTSRSPALNALTDLTEGSGSEVSAPVVEHFINSMLAGLGETTLMLIDGAYEKTTGIEAPSKKLKDVPGFVFIGDANKPNNRYTKEYYAYMNDILDARNNFKSRIDDSLTSRVWDKSEKTAAIFAERGGYDGVKLFTASNKIISAFRKALNEIYNSPDFSGDEKTKMIDEVYGEINAVMAESVYLYEDLLQKQSVQSEREP